MKVTVLLDDLSVGQPFLPQHGLSLWIATKRHTILFDFGQDATFLHHANVMNLDITSPDFAILSHGHYDHAGGIPAYFDVAPEVKVYVQPGVDGAFYGQRGDRKVYIGIPLDKIDRTRLRFSETREMLAPGVWLLAQPKGTRFLPAGNRRLFQKKGNTFEEDTFDHEHSLLIEDKGRWFLFAGCSHRGIVNIMDAASEIIGQYPNVVFGGLHLKSEDEAIMDDLGAFLVGTGAVIYSGHCTDEQIFVRIKNVCKDKARPFAVGQTINL